MKMNCFFFCFLLFLGCGSPLDEGYWKDHNRVADIDSDDSESRRFDIEFNSLHTNIDMTFRDQNFRRVEDGKVSLTVTIDHPNQIIITGFRIRNVACPSPGSSHNYPTADTETPFTRNNVDLNTVSDDVNGNLEDQFIYLTGQITSGTATTDLACSDIRL